MGGWGGQGGTGEDGKNPSLWFPQEGMGEAK